MVIELVFEPIKQQLKRDLLKWEGIKGKRSDAGKESARLRALKAQQNSTNPTSVESVQQSSTNPTVSVNDNVTVNVSDTVNVKEKVIEEIVYTKDVHTCLFNCLKFFPDHLHPKENQKGNWLDAIEKLNRIEKLPFDIIEGIVKKTRKDDFWAKNFLAIPKLRKKDKNGVMYILVFKESVRNGETENKFSEENTIARMERWGKAFEHLD